MKRKLTGCLALLLTVCMAFTLAIPGLADREKEDFVYVAIGDSIAGGMRNEIDPETGKRDHQTLYYSRCNGSYPSLVAEAVGLGEDLKTDLDEYSGIQSWSDGFYPFLSGGTRTSEVLHMLTTDEEYAYDYDDPYVNGDYKSILLKADYLRKKTDKKPAAEKNPEQENMIDRFYKEGETEFALINRVKEADLITLGVGMNDFALGPVVMTGIIGDAALPEVDTDDPQELLEAVSKLPALLEEGYNTFTENYPIILEKLLEFAPEDVTILLVGYYNPYANVSLLPLGEGDGLGLGDLIGVVMQRADHFIKELAEQYDNVSYVDITGVSTDDYKGNKYKEVGQKNLLSDGIDSFMEAAQIDPHPNWYGHAYIAEKVLSVYRHVNEEKILLPQKGNLHLEIGGADGGFADFKKSGLGWTIETEKGYLGYPGSEKAAIWQYDGCLYSVKTEKTSKKLASGFNLTYYKPVIYYIGLDQKGKPTVTQERTEAVLYRVKGK